ncbi:MAG: hypothetical protein JO316_21315 [Abitibacteriaceae bacterium]|nr:hypothetical protein [Abditibacteriaceae bacterium]
MKSLLPSLLVASALQLAFAGVPVAAQNTRPSQSGAAPATQLPVLQAEPTSLGPNTVVTLNLTANFPVPNPRLRVGLFEAGRPIMLADVIRDFVQRNGSYQTSITIQGDPGAYELRIVSNDKAHAALSQSAPLLIPGVHREAGWWLLNDSPFFTDAGNLGNNLNNVAPTAPTTGPLFLPALKRDLNHKGKVQPHNVFTAAPVNWNVIKLPALHDATTNEPPLDWRASIANALRTAQASAARNYLGFELPIAAHNNIPLAGADVNLIKQIRQLVENQAPDAALLLGVEVNDDPSSEAAVEAINAYGAFCDGVVIHAGAADSIWPVKAARRLAEEQAGYDLPIFVQGQDVTEEGRLNVVSPPLSSLDYFMSGATGLISQNDPAVAWQRVVARNLPLFLGSVTLEDIGVLPLPESLGAGNEATPQLYRTLRDAGRVPQVARTLSQKEQKEFAKVPESFCVALGERISDATVEQFKATVKAGGIIYMEGAPLLDERGQPAWKLASLVGATATGIERKQATMILEDPWTWGAGHGARATVEQNVQVKLSPTSLEKLPKPERGKDVLTGPRVAARLEDGSPAVIITPVGKGEVIWMPYHLIADGEGGENRRDAGLTDTLSQKPATHEAQPTLGTPRAPDAVLPNINRATPLQRYYAAIAGYMQQSLVHVRGTDAQQAGAEAIRVAVRRSAKNTLLVALFNTSNQSAAIGAAVGGAPGVALDLADDDDLPLTVRGYQSEATVTIPAGGWKLIAFAESRKALEDERNASHLQAHLR